MYKKIYITLILLTLLYKCKGYNKKGIKNEFKNSFASDLCNFGKSVKNTNKSTIESTIISNKLNIPTLNFLRPNILQDNTMLFEIDFNNTKIFHLQKNSIIDKAYFEDIFLKYSIKFKIDKLIEQDTGKLLRNNNNKETQNSISCKTAVKPFQPIEYVKLSKILIGLLFLTLLFYKPITLRLILPGIKRNSKSFVKMTFYKVNEENRKVRITIREQRANNNISDVTYNKLVTKIKNNTLKRIKNKKLKKKVNALRRILKNKKT